MGGTLKIILRFWFRLLWHIFIWIGGKLFIRVVIYSPKDIVEGVSFTNSEDYVDRLLEIEKDNYSKGLYQRAKKTLVENN